MPPPIIWDIEINIVDLLRTEGMRREGGRYEHCCHGPWVAAHADVATAITKSGKRRLSCIVDSCLGSFPFEADLMMN